jgi:hypothetical protein
MTDDGISVFVTSRPNIQESQTPPHNARIISLSAKKEDLRTYLLNRINQKQRIANIVSKHPPDDGKDVIATLIEAANGM